MKQSKREGWYRPVVIQHLRELKQGKYEFKASLGYMMRSCL
jgi:hypothetical protein